MFVYFALLKHLNVHLFSHFNSNDSFEQYLYYWIYRLVQTSKSHCVYCVSHKRVIYLIARIFRRSHNILPWMIFSLKGSRECEWKALEQHNENLANSLNSINVNVWKDVWAHARSIYILCMHHTFCGWQQWTFTYVNNGVIKFSSLIGTFATFKSMDTYINMHKICVREHTAGEIFWTVDARFNQIEQWTPL